MLHMPWPQRVTLRVRIARELAACWVQAALPVLLATMAMPAVLPVCVKRRLAPMAISITPLRIAIVTTAISAVVRGSVAPPTRPAQPAAQTAFLMQRRKLAITNGNPMTEMERMKLHHIAQRARMELAAVPLANMRTPVEEAATPLTSA